MTAVFISPGAALESSEGDHTRLSWEVAGQLAARLARWDLERLKFRLAAIDGDLFMTFSDGVHNLTVKFQLEPFSAGASGGQLMRNEEERS